MQSKLKHAHHGTITDYTDKWNNILVFPWSEELKYTSKNYYEESQGQVGKTHFVAKKLVTNYWTNLSTLNMS